MRLHSLVSMAVAQFSFDLPKAIIARVSDMRTIYGCLVLNLAQVKDRILYWN